MNLLKAAITADEKLTFASVTKVRERRSKTTIVEIGAKAYGISNRRIAASKLDDDTELYVSSDGKWLIPADTVDSIEADW